MHWLKSLRDPEYMVALEWWTVLALRIVVILGKGTFGQWVSAHFWMSVLAASEDSHELYCHCQ